MGLVVCQHVKTNHDCNSINQLIDQPLRNLWYIAYTKYTILHVLANIIKSLDIYDHIQLLLLDLSADFDILDHNTIKQILVDISLTDTFRDRLYPIHIAILTFSVKRSISIKTKYIKNMSILGEFTNLGAYSICNLYQTII